MNPETCMDLDDLQPSLSIGLCANGRIVARFETRNLARLLAEELIKLNPAAKDTIAIQVLKGQRPAD